MRNSQTQSSTNQVQHLAKMAITRPEEAVRQILSDESMEQDIRALRVYPESLISLWRAENASRTMREFIGDELEAVGIQMLS